MKTLYIILGVLLAVFVIIQLIGMNSQRGIEKYPYKVIKEYNKFEIRKYEASLFTSVKLSTGKYESGSSNGFSILAGYIFGGNDKNQKIAMTSPVAMSMEDSMEVMFLVPKEYKKEDLPTPNQSEIQFKEVPEKTMASITFGGWADSEKIEKYKLKLIKLLEEKEIAHLAKFYFHGYNAPYEVVNRKNEILVELEGKVFP